MLIKYINGGQLDGYLEKHLSLPVVTSNQATFEAVLEVLKNKG